MCRSLTHIFQCVHALATFYVSIFFINVRPGTFQQRYLITCESVRLLRSKQHPQVTGPSIKKLAQDINYTLPLKQKWAILVRFSTVGVSRVSNMARELRETCCYSQHAAMGTHAIAHAFNYPLVVALVLNLKKQEITIFCLRRKTEKQ